MPTVRDIPEIEWKWAYQALRFYFSCRGEPGDAEDLTQRTIAAILTRDDYDLREPEDFRRLCYGFAANILQSHRREKARLPVPFPDGMPDTPEPRDGARTSEYQVLLREVQEIGRRSLTEDEWELIEQAAESIMAGEIYNFPPRDANKLRVLLHRLRKKLARLSGWKKL